MAGNKTNSNSITAILVTKLNNKKSGFRSKILSEWEIPDDTIFYDGTYTTLPFEKMGNAHVDIVGKSKSKVVIMIEVKANIKEELQETQNEDGAYQSTAKEHQIKLKYIIPEGYEHEKTLLNSSKNNIYCKIIKWSWIYEIAKEYDSTGFCNDIEYFVDNDFGTNDLLLTKSEVAMFLSPETIKKVSDLDFGFTSFMSEYVNPNNGIKWKGNKRELIDGLGWKYLLGEKEIWIGFAEIEEDSKHSLFIYYYNKDAFTSETLCPNFTEGKDYYLKNDNYEIWVPIVDEKGEIPEFLYKDYNENRQNEFNSLMNFNLKRFLCILDSNNKEVNNIKKYPENKTVLSPKIIGAVSSLDYKIQTMLGNFIENEKEENLKCENVRDYEHKLGWYYDLNGINCWIGLYKIDTVSNYSFFIYIYADEIYIPIVEEDGNIPEFLFSENVDDQQNKFNDLVKNNIEKLLK